MVNWSRRVPIFANSAELFCFAPGGGAVWHPAVTRMDTSASAQTGEGLVLHLLLHRRRLHFEDAAVGLHQGGGGDNRDDIVSGAAGLGLPLEEHIDTCIRAMQGIARDLCLEGTALSP